MSSSINSALGVSTHSRLKAAGSTSFIGLCDFISFNTQPPEGGWSPKNLMYDGYAVSTHSRLKAAGTMLDEHIKQMTVSTHSRLKAAGILRTLPPCNKSSFNTQPPEGGWTLIFYL